MSGGDDLPGSDEELSVWGWGLAERFADRKEREQLAGMLEGMLGFPELEVQDPVDPDQIELQAPRCPRPADLTASISSEHRARIRHAYGKGYKDLIRGFKSQIDHPPDLVARPGSEEEIVELLGWASDHRVAVVPFGGGTSVVGGVEPLVGDRFEGVLSLDLRAMDQVLEVDETSRTARIQAGALGPAINQQLAEHDLSLRHYPQSYEFSTLGGWLATRAGGHYATVYTHIDDLCQTLRLVTPTGAIAPRRLPASGAGPDPKRLILGSEGALGVITEAWMRVQPRPQHKAKAQLRFEDWWEAVEATRAIVQSGLTPAQCRLLDARQAMLDQVSLEGEHVLVVGFESPEHPVDHALDQAIRVAEEHGGRVEEHGVQEGSTDGADEGYRSSFFEAPYLFNALVSMGVVVDTFETAVPWDGFPALHRALHENVRGVMEEVCEMGLLACRFTHVYPDGPAPYYTFLAPGEQGRELAQWQAIKQAASDTLMDHGATITHHHAVGRTHKPWYHQEAPDRFLDALRAVKAEVDPAGIMNPGVLL